MHICVPTLRRTAAGRLLAALAAAAGLLLAGPLPSAAADEPGGMFAPPLPAPLTVLAGFDPPAQRWLAGNRGVDLTANTGEPVFAATAGNVVYAGELAGRGVVSIARGGLHVTYEPVSPVVSTGVRVARGQLIGHVSGEADACGPPGSCLHWGVRDGATYLDPMKLLARHPPVRLLPIWTDGLPERAPESAPVAVPVVAATSTRPPGPEPPPATARPAAHRGAPDRVGVTASRAAALGGGAVLGVAVGALGLRRRSARRASRAAGAPPWCASGRSGFP